MNESCESNLWGIHAERNIEILRMRKEGATYQQIAQAANLSPERIRQIIAQADADVKREQMLHRIRLSNDINRNWPHNDLLSALGFSNRATSVLLKHFAAQGIQYLSLKELLDFLLPDEYSLDAYTMANLPVFRVKHLGSIIYASLVNRISGLNLGNAFDDEVRRRKAKLMEYFKRHHLSYSHIKE